MEGRKPGEKQKQYIVLSYCNKIGTCPAIFVPDQEFFSLCLSYAMPVTVFLQEKKKEK